MFAIEHETGDTCGCLHSCVLDSLKREIAMYDLDKPCLCKTCGEPMSVRMPIWITPGGNIIHTGDIDYESSNPKNADFWYCPECDTTGEFPAEQTGE